MLIKSVAAKTLGENLRPARAERVPSHRATRTLHAQSRLSAQGGSRDDLQQQMDAAKQRGVQIAETSYIGGKSLPDGTSMQFYLVGVRQQTGASVDYQPYMFTLDHDGKIAKVQ